MEGARSTRRLLSFGSCGRTIDDVSSAGAEGVTRKPLSSLFSQTLATRLSDTSSATCCPLIMSRNAAFHLNASKDMRCRPVSGGDCFIFRQLLDGNSYRSPTKIEASTVPPTAHEKTSPRRYFYRQGGGLAETLRARDD
jgi:hypothetical protein